MTIDELKAAKAAKKERKMGLQSIGHIMAVEFKKAKTEYETADIKFHMTDDCKHWCVRFKHKTHVGDKTGEFDPLNGGEYIFNLTATSDVPFSPPNFEFITPNGVYVPLKLPCVDMGTYHSSNYPAALGMGGFAMNIINGLICPPINGLNLLNTSKETRAKLAKDSRVYNIKHAPELTAIFDELDAIFESKALETFSEISLDH